MARHRVPTARFRVCDSADDALAVVARGEFGYPLVIKADGLAAGKGVVIAEDRAAAEAAVRAAMVDRRSASAGDRVVLEEFLVGEEASYFVLADGAPCVPLSSAQDHKRIFDDDRGPNTGGMGAFAPSPLLTPRSSGACSTRSCGRCSTGMAGRGPSVPRVPLRRPDADGRRAEGDRVQRAVRRSGSAGRAADARRGPVVAARAPRRPARCRRARRGSATSRTSASCWRPAAIRSSAESGKPIIGLEAAAAVPGALVFHAGTARRDGRLVTAGGRVLTVVGRGPTYREAIDVAYRAASHVRFDGMQLRRDIGRRRSQPVTAAPLKYAVVTFGCRVNQADSLAIEGQLLRARRVAGAAGRGRRGRRQHLLGDGDRRPGRAADDPAHRPRRIRRCASS